MTEQDRVTYEHQALCRYALEQSSYAECPVVWTLTTGRSGTGWLAEALNTFPAIRACHEPYPALFSEARMAMDGAGSSVRAMWLAREQLVRESYNRRMVYVECHPFLQHLVPALGEAFAGSRFLHLVRDPRAFVCSAMSRGWMRYFDGPWGHLWPRRCPHPLTNQWHHRRLIWLWCKVHSYALRVEKALGEHAVLRLHSEDLWDGDGLERLIGWMSPGMLDKRQGYMAAARETPVVHKGAPETWQEAWDAELREEAETQDCLELVEHYGIRRH